MRGRGQALVLLALVMLTTVLLALMTASLSERAKERIELQSAADQAAWNNAVATARAMNSSALLTRAQIAHFVAVAGGQALISFAGAYRGHVNALENYYRLERDAQRAACRGGRRCGCAGRQELDERLERLGVEQHRLDRVWQSLDAAAGRLVFEAGATAFGLQATENLHLQRHLLDGQLKGARLAAEVVRRQAAGRPGWRAAPLDAINAREVGEPGTTDGAVLEAAMGRTHGVWAVMGSIGNPFTTARLDSALTVQSALRRAMGNDEPVVLAHFGTAYFSDNEHENGFGQVTKTAAWADDHGLLGVQYRGSGCDALPQVLRVRGVVKSTDTRDGTDRHDWLPAGRPGPSPRESPAVTHTANTCTNVDCPAMLFYWQDYNMLRVDDAADLFGQPKNYAIAQIDRAAARPDPFNLLARLRLSASGPGATLDLRGLQAADGTDLSKSTALSAGMAYYHRRGHWKEPPNLFNPFWRAGLVRADIDSQARTHDLWASLVQAGDPVAAEAVRALYRAGYRGIP